MKRGCIGAWEIHLSDITNLSQNCLELFWVKGSRVTAFGALSRVLDSSEKRENKGCDVNFLKSALSKDG
jgi:hypothetical protein